LGEGTFSGTSSTASGRFEYNKGRVTVVLHWEKEHPPGHPPQLQVGLSTTRAGSLLSSIGRRNILRDILHSFR
jgi:hypothetical protein